MYKRERKKTNNLTYIYVNNLKYMREKNKTIEDTFTFTTFRKLYKKIYKKKDIHLP